MFIEKHLHNIKLANRQGVQGDRWNWNVCPDNPRQDKKTGCMRIKSRRKIARKRSLIYRVRKDLLTPTS